MKIFQEYGKNLGEAIKMIMFALDPHAIVLGGSVSKSWKYFETSLSKSINDFAYQKSAARIRIEVSDRKFIAILGAAALYYDAKGFSKKK